MSRHEGFLKTVFEVDIGLFGKHEEYIYHSLIVVSADYPFLLYRSALTEQLNQMYAPPVMGDHLSTPSLQATLSQDLHRVWGSLAKPDGLTDARIEDYFHSAFEGCPTKQSTVDMIYCVREIHYFSQILTADKFEAAVA